MNQHYAGDEIHSVPGNLQSRDDEITGTQPDPHFDDDRALFPYPPSPAQAFIKINISRTTNKSMNAIQIEVEVWPRALS
ncbi:MAG: hypothetical protein Q7J68_02020 [Thermoplasmata archaeon]|nr:hypothetical protein [Thermoplasmata archaeon]